MSNFDRRTAIRIALVSVAMAFLAGPIAWFLALERAEESVVALANEESGRLLHRFDSINLSGPQAEEHAQAAAYAISGGLFDIAEIYDTKGRKLAESLTAEGHAVEPQLPSHGTPHYQNASYESLKPGPNLWILRVFVPLRNSATDLTALMAGFASLACGAVLYMVLVNDAMQSLIVGSFLHDVGKIGIPDAILLKPGRLDNTEMGTMRTHVAQGENIVGGIDWPASVRTTRVVCWKSGFVCTSASETHSRP